MIRTSLSMLALVGFAVGSVHAGEPCDDATLFCRMGGEPTARSVTVELVKRFTTDARIGHFFSATNLTRLEEKLYEQICNLGGGPCRYSGDPMKESHRGLEIGHADFARVVELVREVLDQHGVREREKNELLRLFAPMKRDIVEGRQR